MESEIHNSKISSTDRHELQSSHDRLEKDNKELRRSNAQLEDFASIASHDLQSPLRAISQMAQILEEDYGSNLDAAGHEIIYSMIRHTKRMKLLMDDLLQYAKITSDIAIESPPLSARNALSQAIENLQDDIRENKAKINFNDLPDITVDGIILSHVFQNLIANALNYRRSEPPEIHISAKKEANMWLFHVADNGIGIDEKYYERIFEPFKRLHGQSIPGTGLGLAVCRKIIEHAGGKIWVSSRKDQGSDFYFTVSEKTG